jgi:uncharacterized protein YndB with AHSA1/START domain
MKHVRILEEANLVSTRKSGRIRECRLGPEQMDDATAWIERYREQWERRLDRLEALREEKGRRCQMTYELKIERLFDAPPELVFDTLVDPDAQAELFDDQVPGWGLLTSELDLRVGGSWDIVFGPADGKGEADRLHCVFTEVVRPRRLAYDMSMFVGEWGRTVDSTVTYTFEDRDGKTLLTIVQGGFETESDRDAYLEGTPGFIDSLQRAVAARTGIG